MQVYEPGNTIRVYATFQFEDDGMYFAPGTVTCQYINPTGNAVSSATVVEDSIGQYHADIVASDPGVWLYRWSATDPSAAERGQFEIRESPFLS